MIKDKRNKTRCTKKSYRFTAKEVALIARCSTSYVHKIRNNQVELDSDKARLVLSIDEVLIDGTNKLLLEVERILS